MELIKIPTPGFTSVPDGSSDQAFKAVAISFLNDILPSDWRKYADIRFSRENVLVKVFFPKPKIIHQYPRKGEFLIDADLIQKIWVSITSGKLKEEHREDSVQLRNKLKEELQPVKELLAPDTTVHIITQLDEYLRIQVERFFEPRGMSSSEIWSKRVFIEIFPDGKVSDMEFDLNITKHRDLLRTHRFMIEAHEKLESEVKIVINHIPDWFWKKQN